MAELLSSTIIVRSTEPITAKVDDEVVMLDARQSSYFGLDEIGSAIWELLESPRSVIDLCRELVDRYEVSPEDCQRDVTTFLTDLIEAGLIETRRAEVAAQA